MKIKSVKFWGSVTNVNKIQFKRLPEIAICGRSNVGKSSLINCLINRKNLALISSTPGKTRILNYYCVNEMYYLVDLPGYGYAKVSQNERMTWKRLIESYLLENPFIKGIIEIIDSRHGITRLDQEMINWLAHLGLPTLLVATKTDKLPRSKANHIIKKLETEAAEWGIAEVIPFSIVTKQGKDQIWRSTLELLNQATEL
ncbi:MAG: YihA family ribosome biogenesis GTP-binding protein [bacterium]|nr:MAG: YihA family ribosome biogenesis GTP-binding protein [bacterium]